jgi:hypothetical protein
MSGALHAAILSFRLVSFDIITLSRKQLELWRESIATTKQNYTRSLTSRQKTKYYA